MVLDCLQYAKFEVEIRLAMTLVTCCGGLPSGKNKQYTADSWLPGSKIIICEEGTSFSEFAYSSCTLLRAAALSLRQLHVNPCEFAYPHIIIHLEIGIFRCK